MDKRSQSVTTAVLFGGLLIAVAVVGAIALLGNGDENNGLGEDDAIDPALIRYELTATIPTGLEEPKAIAVGPDGRIHVAGDTSVHIFDSEGTVVLEIPLDGKPTCMAVGSAKHDRPGRIYVGLGDRVALFDADGTPAGVWTTFNEDSLLTSIALAGADVAVADAGNAIVWHFDAAGGQRGRIGEPDESRDFAGFGIPSPYFDVAVGPDLLLHVVNPAMLRIETYTFGGDFVSQWGTSSSKVDGFNGCCNPSHFAMFSDGRFVTAEKGKSRVKVCDRNGKLECVVAGPDTVPKLPADISVDGQDRVLILDAQKCSVRVFEYQGNAAGEE